VQDTPLCRQNPALEHIVWIASCIPGHGYFLSITAEYGMNVHLYGIEIVKGD